MEVNNASLKKNQHFTKVNKNVFMGNVIKMFAMSLFFNH